MYSMRICVVIVIFALERCAARVLVHGVDFLFVFFRDDVALELLRGREFAAIDGEVAVQDCELLHLLSVRYGVFVVLVDTLLDVFFPLGVALRLRHCLDVWIHFQRCAKELFSKAFGAIGDLAQRHEQSVVLAFVTNHHNVRNRRTVSLDGVFNRHWRDVLAAGGDDEFLDAAGDAEQVGVFIDRPNVTAVQPTFGVNAFLGLFQVVQVSHHDVTATKANLALALLVAASDVVELQLDARNGNTARTRLEVVRLAHVLRTSVLGHTIHFKNVDTDRTEVVERVLHDRRSAREAYARLIQTNRGVRLLLHETHGKVTEERFARGGANLSSRVHASAFTLHKARDRLL
mmetsp:Transcript_8476/g.31528  ORF Transcript_8476/g.31528 Transcript_8476/m.31528 type:complete len:346 (+) Transcript_8476:256-1293(+)